MISKMIYSLYSSTKKIHILLVIILFSTTNHAQESKLFGRWQLKTINNVNAEEKFVFSELLEFLPNNIAIIKLKDSVFWKYQNGIILMTDQKHHKYKDSIHILQLEENTLTIKNNRKDNLVFKRLKNTQKKDIYGIWIVKAIKRKEHSTLFKDNMWIHLKKNKKALIGQQGEKIHFDQKKWDIDLKENIFFFDSNKPLEIIHHSPSYIILNNKHNSKILLKKK